LNSLSTQYGAEVVGFCRHVAKGGVVAGVLLALAGCAALDRGPPEEVVVKRAQERWDALVKGDVKSAYGYLSPGSRAVMDLASYESSIRRGFWKAAKVDKAVCASQQSCDAHVTIEYEFRGARTKTPLRETWIQEGSNWWLVQK
jgi:hypothetical protein